MERPRPAALVVLTLLQLCRAEHILPQWYSVNLNENFQPKPISELFSSEPPFSTAKPIIVTQKSTNSISDELDLLSSTYAPPTSRTFPTQYFETSTTSTPAPVYQQNQIHPLKVDILPQQQNYLQTKVPTYVPPILIQTPPANQPELRLLPEVPAQLRKINAQQIEPVQTYTPILPLNTLFQPQSQTTQADQNLIQDSKPTQGQSVLALTTPSLSRPQVPNSNYFLIYQQAPQSFQYPTSSQPLSGTPEVTIRQSTPTTYSLPTRTSEALTTTRELPSSSISTTPLPTTWISSSPSPTTWSTTPPSTWSTTPPSTWSTTPPSTWSTNPPFTWSTPPPSTWSTPPPSTWSTTQPTSDWTSTLSSSSVRITPSSTFGLSNGDCLKSTTALPKKGGGLLFPLKIRVIAPSGSITNLNINPPATTKVPYRATKTVTRKPTTRKTSKPKKNSYDRCLDGCRKVKDPICAAPLAHKELDPSKLRGFPSVCHMACHNSYRKDPFEKVIEGSCSKLRTKIRLIDSRSKLKKDELHKNEYYVVKNGAPTTIIELSN